MELTVRSTGTLLVAAFVLFLVGAGFWLVREFERPLAEMSRAMAVRRRRWTRAASVGWPRSSSG